MISQLLVEMMILGPSPCGFRRIFVSSEAWSRVLHALYSSAESVEKILQRCAVVVDFSLFTVLFCRSPARRYLCCRPSDKLTLDGRIAACLDKQLLSFWELVVSSPPWSLWNSKGDDQTRPWILNLDVRCTDQLQRQRLLSILCRRSTWPTSFGMIHLLEIVYTLQTLTVITGSCDEGLSFLYLATSFVD